MTLRPLHINLSHQEAEEYSNILADILCFFSGVEYATAIQPNKKTEAALKFFNKEKIRQLKHIFDSQRMAMFERIRILEASEVGEVVKLRQENAILKQQIRDTKRKAVKDEK